MIAGLEDPTSGSIRIGEQDVTGLKAYQRPVNTVFQSYALFPHLDIFENVAFGLRRRRVKGQAEGQRHARARPARADGTAQADQLSGGQQQRVAVAGP
jgi:spermidine/putrescine transport system ATP-binding protein